MTEEFVNYLARTYFFDVRRLVIRSYFREVDSIPEWSEQTRVHIQRWLPWWPSPKPSRQICGQEPVPWRSGYTQGDCYARYRNWENQRVNFSVIIGTGRRKDGGWYLLCKERSVVVCKMCVLLAYATTYFCTASSLWALSSPQCAAVLDIQTCKWMYQQM